MVENFPVISPDKCVSCGVCVKTCPKAIIELQTLKARVWVPCSTKALGKDVKAVCEVGCIGCKLCVKVCPANAVAYENNLIKIDHKACIAYGPSCEEICVSKCPRDIFRKYDGRRVIARDVAGGLRMAG
jgi:electron transport complex protein RnfB